MAQYKIKSPETKRLFEKGGIEVEIVSEPRETVSSPRPFSLPIPVAVDYFAYDVPSFEPGPATPLAVLLDRTSESYNDQTASTSPYTSIEHEIQGQAS